MAYVGKITDTAGVTGLVGSTLYGTCTTAAGTAAKVVTLSAFDKLIDGIEVRVRFKESNTASNPTLNINSTGAKAIILGKFDDSTQMKPGTNATASWTAGQTVSFTYTEKSGTGYWVMNTCHALTTDSINVVTAGTAVSVNKITEWDAGSLPTLGTAFTVPNVTSVGSAPTLGTAFTIPNVTSAGSASSMTKSNVEFYGVDTINNAVPSATISEGVLTIATPTATITKTSKLTATYISAWSAGSAPTLGTAFTVPNVTSVGSAPTLGTAFTIPNVTGVGALPSLTYNDISITPYTTSTKTVVVPKTS